MRRKDCCQTRTAFLLIVMILLDNALHAARIMPSVDDHSQRSRNQDGVSGKQPFQTWSGHRETSHQDMDSTSSTVHTKKRHWTAFTRNTSSFSDPEEESDGQLKVKHPLIIGSGSQRDDADAAFSGAWKKNSPPDTMPSPVSHSDSEFRENNSYEARSGLGETTKSVFESVSMGDFSQSLTPGSPFNNSIARSSSDDANHNFYPDNVSGVNQSMFSSVIPVPWCEEIAPSMGSPSENPEKATNSQLPWNNSQAQLPFEKLLRKKRKAVVESPPENSSQPASLFDNLFNTLDFLTGFMNKSNIIPLDNMTKPLLTRENKSDDGAGHFSGSVSVTNFSVTNSSFDHHGFHGHINDSNKGEREDDHFTDKTTLSTTASELMTENLLYVTSTDILTCIGYDGDVEMSTTSGRITVHSEAFRNVTTDNAVCRMKVLLPQGHSMELKGQFWGQCDVLLFFVWETHSRGHRNLFDACSYKLPKNWKPINITSYSSSNSTVFFSFQVTRSPVPFLSEEERFASPSFSLDIQFSVFPDSQKLLNVTFLTPQNGSIMTRGWDGITVAILCMDTWVVLPIPEDHAVMVSMLHIDIPGTWIHCRDAFVGLYSDLEFTNKLQVFCGNAIGRPASYSPDSGKLYVRFFQGWSYVPVKGFELLFSFHSASDQLQVLSDDRWNCSVSNWSDFKHHFPCNLRAECAGQEDETPCPYTTSGCGAGRIAIKDRCYIYRSTSSQRQVLRTHFYPVTLDRNGKVDTWKDAEDACRQSGARLASLGSFRERQEVMDLLFASDSPDVFIGMIPVEVSAPYIYREMWRHLDGTVAYYTGRIIPTGHRAPNSIVLEKDSLTKIPRNIPYLANVLCEVPKDNSASLYRSENSLRLAPAHWSENASFVMCPDGHVTHSFLACDQHSHCWAGSPSGSCMAPLTPLPPSFRCGNGVQHAPYMLVCDHHADCSDRSDELFCVFPSCDVSTQFQCTNLECVSLDLMCDEVPNCKDGSDEEQCGWMCRGRDIMQTLPPPALVTFDGHGWVVVKALNDTHPKQQAGLQTSDDGQSQLVYYNVSSASDGKPFRCPETHFQCADDDFCLPVHVRCNGMFDCPGHEDEMSCDRYTCPGFYRCRGSYSCVHQTQMCDGVYQCPQRDDELLCGVICPHNCTCFGMALTCQGVVSADLHPQLRYLDASDSSLDPSHVAASTMLIYLNLARCNIADLSPVNLPNLQHLDLSGNHIHSLTPRHLLVPNLRHLRLANNPLSLKFTEKITEDTVLTKLVSLDLTGVHMPELNASVLSVFPSITTLNLSQCGVVSVLADGFTALSELTTVDLTGSSFVFFPRNLFEGLGNLHNIVADNYKLCCPALLPSRFNPANCKAPSNEISSCKALLRSDFYRCFLSIFAVLSLLGNVVSLLARAMVKKCCPKMGFDVFVTNLCMSDLLMGVYLAIIGIADRLYMGTYLWNDVFWRNSTACKVAGFLCVLSSEVSFAIICLITIDRFLVLRFPFSRFRFNKKQALRACALTWVAGLIIAAIPLMPWTPRWEFYNQTGICISLPINRVHFVGQRYAFGIMIVFNFVLFLLTAVGQVFIYWSVKRNKMQSSTSGGNSGGNSQKDFIISQRLVVIAVSDFLCWLPIGMLGILASRGVPIASEVNVAVAILVLPVNSAINPFLYTLNILCERLRLQRERRLHQFLLSRMMSMNEIAASSAAASYQHCNQDEALQIFKRWLNKAILSRETVMRYVIGKESPSSPSKPAQGHHVLDALVAQSAIVPAADGECCDRQCSSTSSEGPLSPDSQVDTEDSGQGTAEVDLQTSSGEDACSQ